MSEATRRFTRGAGWIYAFRGLERCLEFLAIVVLARLLAPEDFGLVAIAASYVTIIEGLSQFDVQKALIRERREDDPLYDSAWTLSVLRGLLAALVLLAVSPFVGDVRMAAVLRVLALVPVLDGLANPRFVMFERDLLYSRVALQALAAKVASVGLTLAVAFAYRSYWALVLGFVAGSLARLLLSFVLRPYRPRPSLARFREIFAFSGWMSLATMLTTLSMETDKIIVGRLLGVADAGRYFMTQRIGVLPTRELVSPLQRILFPSYSEIADDRPRLRRVVTESINVLGSLSLPASVGFALVAGDFVPLALGATWAPIVPLLVVLVPYLGVRATLSMALPCAMALGRTRLLFQATAVYAPIHLLVFIAGTAWFGLRGAIWSIVLAGVLYTGLNAWILRRTVGVPAGAALRQLRRPLVAVVAMVGAVALADAALPVALVGSDASWLALAVKVGVGAPVFVAAQYLLWRREGRPDGLESRLLQLVPRRYRG